VTGADPMPDPVADRALSLSTKRESFAFFVRQASPRILATLTIIFGVMRLVAGHLSGADAAVLLIIPALWHLQERLLHEYLLHLRARRFLSWRLLRRISEHHRRHHLDPWRTATLFITTSAYLFTVPTVMAVLFIITRDVRLTITGSFAYFFTLFIYEWIHCLIHTSYEPRSTWFRRRWLNHRLHHFKNSRYWFGITSPIWDVAFRSRPEPSAVITRKNWRGPNPTDW